MNSSKIIDISKSSLVGLKAELLKKQEEVKRIKEQQLEPREAVTPKQKKKSQEKSNKNVEARILQDEKHFEEDFDAVKKSREMLEAKARLYDKLKSSSSDIDSKKSQYLIDFDLKQEIEKNQKLTEKTLEVDEIVADDEEDNFSDFNSDPENDWVDFTDTLGRSKRCLRKDLPEMKSKDAKLAEELKPPSPPPDTPVAPELLSFDMQREMNRQKWEQQEKLLLEKPNIHYQDVLFDENRTHGVGYFEFSTDEEERLRQQEALKKLRKETEEQQQASVGLRARRQQQLQARLAAARRRKRERLGLPPDSPEPPEVVLPPDNMEEKQEAEEENVKDIEEMITKIAPVRPWDIGKQDGIPVMSQEEWVEMKRQERPAEFAPPSTHVGEAINEFPYSMAKRSNFFTSKKTDTTKPKNAYNTGGYPDYSETHKTSTEVRNINNLIHIKPNEPISNSYSDSREFQNLNNLIHIKPNKPISNSYSDSTSNSMLYNSISANCVKSSDVKDTENRVTQSKDWKPTLADIETLLEKTKQEAQSIFSAMSSCDVDDFSINSSVEMTSMGESEEKHYHREKSVSDRSHKKHTRSKLENPIKIGEIFNEVLVEEASSSTSKSHGFDKKKSNKKWAAIPPPAAFSYYNEENTRTKQNHKRKGDMADSLSVGMNLLKERSEEKNKKRLKGLLDLI